MENQQETPEVFDASKSYFKMHLEASVDKDDPQSTTLEVQFESNCTLEFFCGSIVKFFEDEPAIEEAFMHAVSIRLTNKMNSETKTKTASE